MLLVKWDDRLSSPQRLCKALVVFLGLGSGMCVVGSTYCLRGLPEERDICLR